MSLIHPHGPVCAVSELDLHALPITQQDILKSQTTVKTTNNALTAHTQSFDFTFEPTTLYTDLGDTELYLEFKVQKPDGTALAGHLASWQGETILITGWQTNLGKLFT